MSYSDLLQALGFEADPFATTNADEEDRLVDYFVPPPFFNAVFGQPKNPKSALVFAPRGGGKTALKRKIELSSPNAGFLCLTYNEFDVSDLSAKDITSAYHLKNLVEMLLVAVITAVENRGIEILSSDDRHIIYLMIKEHLSKIDQTRLKRDIAGIKNFSDKAKDLWNKFTGPIGLIINVLLQRIGLGSAEIKQFQNRGGSVGSLADQLRTLRTISSKLGFSSVYVLIDRVDETPLTTGGDQAYAFIAPLMTDLHLLETPGFGFKFFLWDLLLDDYRSVARPDRVKYYNSRLASRSARWGAE